LIESSFQWVGVSEWQTIPTHLSSQKNRMITLELLHQYPFCSFMNEDELIVTAMVVVQELPLVAWLAEGHGRLAV
jgi:hypothetical protein